MDNRFMQNLAEEAWDDLPSSLRKVLTDDPRAPRKGLEVTSTYKGHKVTFRATIQNVVAFIHMEADVTLPNVKRLPVKAAR